MHICGITLAPRIRSAPENGLLDPPEFQRLRACDLGIAQDGADCSAGDVLLAVLHGDEFATRRRHPDPMASPDAIEAEPEVREEFFDSPL